VPTATGRCPKSRCNATTATRRAELARFATNWSRGSTPGAKDALTGATLRTCRPGWPSTGHVLLAVDTPANLTEVGIRSGLFSGTDVVSKDSMYILYKNKSR
jgi:hypothetical protein